MRLIIEVDNEDELKQVGSLITALSIKSLQIKPSAQQERLQFVQWCRDNKVEMDGVLSRADRNNYGECNGD
jgi:hypothetical protein